MTKLPISGRVLAARRVTDTVAGVVELEDKVLWNAAVEAGLPRHRRAREADERGGEAARPLRPRHRHELHARSPGAERVARRALIVAAHVQDARLGDCERARVLAGEVFGLGADEVLGLGLGWEQLHAVFVPGEFGRRIG